MVEFRVPNLHTGRIPSLSSFWLSKFPYSLFLSNDLLPLLFGLQKKNNNQGQNNNNNDEQKQQQPQPQQQKKKNENSEGGGGGKKDDGLTSAVLKVVLDCECEGCANKVRKMVRGIEGVESVKGGAELTKLTVAGKIDPVKLRDEVEKKTKRKVQLVSPLPKKDNKEKDGGGEGEKKAEGKPEKKPDDKKSKEVTVTGSMDMKDMKELAEDMKELAEVTGSMDLKELAEALKEKVKGGEAAKAGGDGGGGDGGGQADENRILYGYGYPVEQYNHAPQIFSDENPNACSVM